MRAMGNFSRHGLPRPIPATDLLTMVGASQTFCSPEALNSTVTDSTARWPFIFSHPRLANKVGNFPPTKPTIHSESRATRG
jgi:hypothetical protein